ncbi:VPLPA-CTERM sorting domain-containing protein [Tateyamaria sp.]|uniref:VPLPA-CTERM sorting domain-containing protein n=1 Tax=Tateyamaria sp. TaxID=1929288 RepID=UPI00329E44D1
MTALHTYVKPAHLWVSVRWLLLAITLMLVPYSAQAASVLIAKNDGSVNFSSALYSSGYGTLDGNNYIANNLTDYDAFGSDVKIKVTMGTVVDYFKPVAGFTLLDMLTSFDKHTWSASETGAYVAPEYFSRNLGGSGYNWVANNVSGDDRLFLSFWGSDRGDNGGGCCDSDYSSPHTGWNKAFTVEVSTTRTAAGAPPPSVPLPAGLPFLLTGLAGLVGLRFRKKPAG